MNKKGTVAYYVGWIFHIITLIVVIFVAVQLAHRAIISDLNTYDLEYYMLTNRLLYSPNSISYFDDTTKRTYPGIIDINKFNEKYMNQTFGDESRFGLKAVLGDKEAYYDKETYDLYYPLLWSEKYGKYNRTSYVLVQDGDKQKLEALQIVAVYQK